MKVAFRVDGGKQIGMGHIMRMLALADKFRERKNIVIFISRLQEGINLIRESGFKVHILERNEEKYFYDNDNIFADEVSNISKIYSNEKFDLLIIDTYNVSPIFFDLLKSENNIFKTCYIDDLNSFKYQVDFIINGNITGQIYNYNEIYDQSVKLMLGTKYCILREEFTKLEKRKLSEKVVNVVITSGGSNILSMCGKIAEFLATRYSGHEINFNILVGSAFSNKEDLYKIEKKYNNIKLIENCKKISKIMIAADIAISSGGSSLYELCICGTPTIAYIVADNQQELVNTMANQGYIISMGWFNEKFEKPLNEELDKLMGNYQMRMDLSRKMNNLVDGKGVYRIIDVLEKN